MPRAHQAEQDEGAVMKRIFNLFQMSGYHRTPMLFQKNILPSTQDKHMMFSGLVGGLGWILQGCHRDDSTASFHYDFYFIRTQLNLENKSTNHIKQRIYISEIVVNEINVNLGCPFPLQPHQVHGLDWISLEPIVEWLIQYYYHSLDQIRSEKRRGMSYPQLYISSLTYSDDQDPALAPPSSTQLEAGLMKRKFRIICRPSEEQENPNHNSLDFRIHQCLLEYDEQIQNTNPKTSSDEEDQHTTFEQQYLKLCEKLKQEEYQMTKEWSTYEQSLAKIPTQNQVGSSYPLSQALSRKTQELLLQSKENRNHSSRFSSSSHTALMLQQKQMEHDNQSLALQIQHVRQYHERIESEVHSWKLSQDIMDKIHQMDQLKQQERSHKREYKISSEHFQHDIRTLEEKIHTQDKKNQRWTRACEDLVLQSQRLSRAHGLMMQRISFLERILDDQRLSRFELIQYERRFIELHDESKSLLEHTRQSFLRYNTLKDTEYFMTKEISLLNSISETYDQISMIALYKDKYQQMTAFLSRCQSIVDQMQLACASRARQVVDHAQQLKETNERHDALLDEQQTYFQAIQEFQYACRYYDTLQEKLTSN